MVGYASGQARPTHVKIEARMLVYALHIKDWRQESWKTGKVTVEVMACQN